MGEYRAIWNRELFSNIRSNVMLAVTDDGQHDTGTFSLHYVPLSSWSAMSKLKMSAAQPTSAEAQSVFTLLFPSVLHSLC